MGRIKYSIVWFLDWVVDAYILRHRWYGYCHWLSGHPWWDALEKR